MNQATKTELLATLELLVDSCPDYRFGQLISNLALIARGDRGDVVYDVEDDELLAAARKHLEDWNRAHSAVA